VDVTFDKSNGSQVELVDKNLVDEEKPPSLSIMRMSLGEVRPHEVQAQTPVEERNNNPHHPQELMMRTSLIWMHTTLLRWTFKVQSLELVHDN
jgi:hypothetical protein